MPFKKYIQNIMTGILKKYLSEPAFINLKADPGKRAILIW